MTLKKGKDEGTKKNKRDWYITYRNVGTVGMRWETKVLLQNRLKLELRLIQRLQKYQNILQGMMKWVTWDSCDMSHALIGSLGDILCTNKPHTPSISLNAPSLSWHTFFSLQTIQTSGFEDSACLYLTLKSESVGFTVWLRKEPQNSSKLYPTKSSKLRKLMRGKKTQSASCAKWGAKKQGL